MSVRQPDLVMIHRSRQSIVRRRGIYGAPDLVVEVLSPGSIMNDRRSKLRTYAKYGVQEYWIVEPYAGTLEQYVLLGDSYELENVYSEDQTVCSEHVPCVRFTMGDIMRGIPKIAD